MDKESKPRFETVNFEGRQHPRFLINLPIEYWQIDKSKSRFGQTIDISESGLLLYLSEPMEIGQVLGLNLFINIGPDLDAIEAIAQVEVVWKDINLGKEGDYRIGVKFVDISAENIDRLKNFLISLMNLKNCSG